MFGYSLVKLLFVKVLINLLLIMMSNLAFLGALQVLAKLLFIQLQGLLSGGLAASSSDTANGKQQEDRRE
jgi:hypothetical protein